MKIFYKFFIFFIIFSWGIIALGRTIINLYKGIQDIPLLSVSEQSKEQTVYGDFFLVKQYMLTHEKYSLVINAPNTYAYFLLRYLLYPQKVFIAKSKHSTHYELTKQAKSIQSECKKAQVPTKQLFLFLCTH